jgi:hypothetical protein
MRRESRPVVSSFALAAAALLMTFGIFGFARAAAAQSAASVTAELEEENDSGITGTAVLTPDGERTLVVIELVGAEEGVEGHMFDSTCDDHGAATVFYDFDPVDADGRSETVVDAPFSDLTTGDYWIHLHEPAVERGGGLVCGVVPEYRAGGATSVPSTGVGTTAGGSQEYSVLLAGLAVAGMFVAFVLLRRARRSWSEATG